MKIPLFKIYWDREDVEAVRNVIRSGMNWATGPKIEEFEGKLAKYADRRYALAFSSGTSALHALLLAYNIGQDDEVIVPSFTFIATANAPLFVGAKPVFAEIEEKTFGLDPKDVEKKISKKTKAILAVHYAGCPCEIKEIKKIAQKHNLILIEDVAEALGAKISKKMVGTYGQAAIFSFCASKIITTGEGGAVVTDSIKVYQNLKLLRSHGRKEKENYFSSVKQMDYIKLGYNFRLSNINAALGISQLKKINKLIKMRRKNAQYLTRKLSPIKKIVPPNTPKDYFHVYQLYTIRIKGGKKTRDALKNYLNRKEIMAKIYFNPLHLTKFYRNSFNYKKGDLPVTERIAEQVLTLPVYPALTKKEMDYIVKQIQLFFKEDDHELFNK